MQKKVDAHIFAGMQKDMAISKHKNEFLYDAYNIRFTPMEGNTMMSITNERGPKYQLACEGKYVGHCVVDKYLVLFTKKINGIDRIVKFEPNTSNTETILYEGNLNFKLDHPLETLGVYENENVIKVYWVDGVNQPRVVNIIDPDHKIQQRAVVYPELETQFDFVRALKLEEYVFIHRLNGNGQFNPGTIQYAFSYYNLYGQQSNIFYTSPLQYISFSDRGAKPDSDKVSNIFSITIGGIDVKSFDYIRVYSIYRGDENGAFEVKRVIDLETSKAVLGAGDSGYQITFVDDGTIGNSVDPNELYYLGGEEIVAGTMCTKDSTMFFGNITLKKKEIPSDIATSIKSAGSSENSISDFYTSYTGLDYFGNKYYSYVNTLSKVKPGFKTNEHYKLGLQFQHKTGKWSLPITVGIHTVNNIYRPLLIGNNQMEVPSIKFSYTFSDDDINKLQELGYKRVRGVCVFPDITERLVLTQGMLCPTVYNYAFRKQNAPYSCSSWFLRPSYKNGYESGGYNVFGNAAEFRHMQYLPDDTKRNAEVQGALGQWDVGLDSEDKLSKEWYVDQSIVTLHSPEVEFDDRFSNLNDFNYRLDIVGYIPFNANMSSIDIEVSTPGAKESNIFTRSFSTTEGGRSFIAGAFWKDGIIIKDGDKYKFASPTGELSFDRYIFTNYMIYPWQRTGSLNNDINKSDNSTRTAILKRKRISNLKFSNNTTFFRGQLSNAEDVIYDITVPQLFNSDEVSLLKIKNPTKGLYDENDLHYYGNVYTTIAGDISPKITVDANGSVIASPEADVIGLKDRVEGSHTIVGLTKELAVEAGPVDIRYKSTKHLVLALLGDDDGKVNILPNFKGFPNRSGDYTVQEFWHTTVPKDAKYFVHVYQTYQDAFDTSIYAYGIVLILDTLQVYNRDFVLNNNNTFDVRLTEVSTAGKMYYYSFVHSIDDIETIYYKGTFGNYVEVYNQQSYTDSTVISQTEMNWEIDVPNLLMGELVRGELDTDFNNEDPLWLPAGEPIKLTKTIEVEYTQGDTWYQRYDCLKTYPFSDEQTNNIIEIGSFMCETRINLDGRYDKNRGLLNNLNISNTNFNQLNHAYSASNNFFKYRELDERFKELNDFPNQITWTLDKWMGNEIDLWTNITLANTLDLDGTKGKIRALRKFNDNILCFQDRAINSIMFNSRVQIPTTDGVPIEISNSGKMDGSRIISDSIGCSNKWSICTTPNALYFMDDNSKKLYAFSDKLQTISDTHGFDHHFKSIKNFDSEHTFYDPIRQDVYLVWDSQCLVWSELLGQFTSFMSYENVPAMFNIGDKFYSIYFSREWNPDPSPTSPNGYVQHDSFINLYEMFKGGYNRFFGIIYPSHITFISNPDGSTDKIFSTLGARLDVFSENLESTEAFKNLQHKRFFDYIQVSNEYQDTGKVSLAQSWIKPASHGTSLYNVKKKFRQWRVDIPRDTLDSEHRLNRIRNTWAKISLGFDPPVDPHILTQEELLAYASANNIESFDIAAYYEQIPRNPLEHATSERAEHEASLSPEVQTAIEEYKKMHYILHDVDVQYFV